MHCTTSRKVAGSIPNGLLEFLIDIILPATLWSCSRLSLLKNWVTWIFPLGKCGQCVGLTKLPPSYGQCHEIWEPQPLGTSRACPGINRDCFAIYNTVLTQHLWCVFHLGVSGEINLLEIIFIFFSNAPTCRCGLRGLPSWAWQKCNRLLRLGRPWGAITLSRWCQWWYNRM